MAKKLKNTTAYATTQGKDEEGKECELMTAQGRYSSLETERNPFYIRAQDASKMTIPSLMPPMGHTGATLYYQPFQSIGAEGVNNLASKFLLTLFPPGSAFFRLVMSAKVLAQLQKKITDPAELQQSRNEFEEALGKIEDAVMTRMEQKGARMALFECFKHLIVCGNALIQVLDSGALKLHKLDRYVVKRDVEGNVIEIVVKETIGRAALPEAVRSIVAAGGGSSQGMTTVHGMHDGVDVFTWVRRLPEVEQWTVHQEVYGQIVPDTEGSYPLDKTPWLPLRYISVDGEDYGRGFVEEHIGALKSLDALSQAIIEGSGQAAKVLWFVLEGGVTSKRKVAQSPNGAVLDGQAKDISTLQMDKFADFQVAKGVADDIKKDLQRAFLLMAGVQRNAERVTAEEVRTTAAELEQSQGGAYSVLAQELQRPLAIREMAQMQKSGDIPHLPPDLVEPQIVTGISGLGRNSDLNKLQTMGELVNQMFPNGEGAQYQQVGAWLKSMAIAIGLPGIEALIKTDADVQQAQAAAQQHELAKQAVAPGIKAVSDAQQAQAAQAAPTQAAA